MKLHPVGAELFPVDTLMVKAKLTVSFHNFVLVPKNQSYNLTTVTDLVTVMFL